MTTDEQLAFLRKGAVDLIREEDLRAKLERSARDGVPLKVKLGADPTAPSMAEARRLSRSRAGSGAFTRNALAKERSVRDV